MKELINMIKKIVFCLILLCCMSSVAFAENPSDNVNETTTNDDIDILELSGCPIVYDHYDGPGCENPTCKNIKPAPFVNYTDTYIVDAETGKFIPLGEVTKPLPENMVMYDDQGVSHNGWGLTYEDIMNHNTQIHPLK